MGRREHQREIKNLSDKNETLEISSKEEINKLRLKNKALEEKINNALKEMNPTESEELVTIEQKLPHLKASRKRSLIKDVVKRMCIHTALRGFYEIIIYLVLD